MGLTEVKQVSPVDQKPFVAHLAAMWLPSGQMKRKGGDSPSSAVGPAFKRLTGADRSEYGQPKQSKKMPCPLGSHVAAKWADEKGGGLTVVGGGSGVETFDWG
jgi:hypothetical protein